MSPVDYCTLWIDGLLWWNWGACCAQHDADYSLGVVKALADEKLRLCVNSVLAPMGDIMWLGVTLFGGFWYAEAARKRAQGS